MTGWDPGYNWKYFEFRKVIDQAFDTNGKSEVSLDVEHSDRKNMDDIMRWAKELGHEAIEALGGDIIRIVKG